MRRIPKSKSGCYPPERGVAEIRAQVLPEKVHDLHFPVREEKGR